MCPLWLNATCHTSSAWFSRTCRGNTCDLPAPSPSANVRLPNKGGNRESKGGPSQWHEIGARWRGGGGYVHTMPTHGAGPEQLATNERLACSRPPRRPEPLRQIDTR